MHQGRIVKGIGGFYYVDTSLGLIECRPRGIFRKDNLTPLVGDRVKISLVEGNAQRGVIQEILPRENQLLRPNVANVDQCVVVSAVERPKPDFLLLDRLLVLSEVNGLDSIVCFNKMDMDLTDNYISKIDTYRQAGYNVICTSTRNGQGIDRLREAIKGRVSVFAGMSGAGKSSIMNSLQPKLGLKTGEISDKLQRGKHTTRHAQLLELEFGGMVVDTPGFSSLSLGSVKELRDMEESDFCYFYPEFVRYIEKCRFKGCIHLKEPECRVKQAVEEERIASFRYENYISLLEELRQTRRRKYD